MEVKAKKPDTSILFLARLGFKTLKGRLSKRKSNNPRISINKVVEVKAKARHFGRTYNLSRPYAHQGRILGQDPQKRLVSERRIQN